MAFPWLVAGIVTGKVNGFTVGLDDGLSGQKQQVLDVPKDYILNG
jgi:hypothetical protein